MNDTLKKALVDAHDMIAVASQQHLVSYTEAGKDVEKILAAIEEVIARHK